jgi:hypothetical protein
VIAERLRSRGHDVLALDEQRELDGLADQDVLALAALESRILVTFNVRDFAPIMREWGEAQRSHAGGMMLVGIEQNQFGLIIDRISATLDAWPAQEDWTDRSVFVGRAS